MADYSPQAPGAVVMVRPHHFKPNPQTASDNGFQRAGADGDAARARAEVTRMAGTLAEAGVRVHLFEDRSERTPDSVFPNNWFSTHPGGHVAIYPMYARNRQLERRWDIVEMLKAEYRVQDVIDYSGLENDGLYLEGTGAMVLDHLGRVAYAVRSNRTSEIVLERFCAHFNFEPMIFAAADRRGRPIYHTNVLMCIGTAFALVGGAMITDPARREEIRQRLAESGRDVIDLDPDQIDNFAGNALELRGRDGRVLALSRRARDSLRLDQIARIEKSARLLPIDVPTIELAGGSVRCMLAGIHLSRRTAKEEEATP